ncbi:MAG: hypothetical protein GYB30_03435 [Gammaproteobacteria bacterium]|nr:hypothetical protein [Gammaproteobacteria bacterium]
MLRLGAPAPTGPLICETEAQRLNRDLALRVPISVKASGEVPGYPYG